MPLKLERKTGRELAQGWAKARFAVRRADIQLSAAAELVTRTFARHERTKFLRDGAMARGDRERAADYRAEVWEMWEHMLLVTQEYGVAVEALTAARYEEDHGTGLEYQHYCVTDRIRALNFAEDVEDAEAVEAVEASKR